ncbi:ATP-grasp domain-containing protein [Paenibacillus sp. UNCCL117]|nr:ATP-grasp domain-containing protein [Paenibacillus sp. cl123]SFW10927.1 ATP-grasp domain-containing protein [Paenibacillus sp. UNCCL117]
MSLYFVFLIPEHSLVETVLDKRLTYELAARYRIPVPKTFIIENANHLEELLPQIPFPCILKPAFGIIFRGKTHLKAIAADNPDDLRKKYLHYSQYSMLMVQELIPGEDHCIVSVKTFYDQEMNLIGMYCNQKLHQFPADLGSACYAVTSNDKEAIEMATSFLQQIHCRGIAGMEFKRDPRDGKLKFMEINARIPLTGALTLNCGVDLAYLYYLSMTGQQPKPVTSQKDGVTWVYLVRMLLTFQVKHKQGKMTYRELARIIFSKKTEAMFTWRDPMPFVRSFISHLKNDWNQKRMSKSSKESVSDAENRNGVCGPPG